MARVIGLIAVILLLTGCAGAQPVAATEPTTSGAGATTGPDVDPLADQILKDSCDYLAHIQAFSVHAEVWKDEVLASGHKIQVTRSIDLDLRRPDAFRIVARAHHKGRGIWDDGKTLTVLNLQDNLYATTDAPGSVDSAVDLLAEQYGITVPLEDLLVSDPYANATSHVTAGGYFGDEPVLGVMCRHIGFSTDRIDWQLWVADSPQPLPQKLVITYKMEDQSPQFTAIFNKWSVLDRASDLAFTFVPPPGSSKISMVAQGEQAKSATEGKP